MPSLCRLFARSPSLKTYVLLQEGEQRTLHLIQEHTLVANHPDLAKTLHDFARFHEGLGRLEVAAILFQQALRIREQVYSSQHPKTIETCEHLQMVLYLLENEQKKV